jgi:hypothetical protein
VDTWSIIPKGPPLWSSGQGSWLQIQGPGFDSRALQEKKVVGLELVHSASLIQLRSYLEAIVAATV